MVKKGIKKLEVKCLEELYVVESQSEDYQWYFVCVDEDQDVRCDCLGFVNHGHCKHSDAVANL